MSKTNTVNDQRLKRIYAVTIKGAVVNMLLVVFKFIAGFFGGSAALVADAVHSLTDFLTDIIMIVFVKLSDKPCDGGHDYGHGKFETLATAIIGFFLLFAGGMILYNAVLKTWDSINGNIVQTPGVIALIAALLAVVLKEWAFRFTMKVGKEIASQATVANAWEHRSDALSSLGTSIGITGAILLGNKWAVLDPIAAIIVSILILKAAFGLIFQAMNELLEASLPIEIKKEIECIVKEEAQVEDIHQLKTRRIGSDIAIEMHLRLPGDMSLYEAHLHSKNIENRLRNRFGERTHIGLHLEPLYDNCLSCKEK